MAKYIAKVGQWVTPSETSGSIQNISNEVTIEVSSSAEVGSGLILRPMQIINFDGTVYVRSAGRKQATFTAVPFKVAAGGGGSGGGGSTYTLPTASDSVKGGIRIGDGLTIKEEVLSADKQVNEWKSGTVYKVGDIVISDNKLYKCVTAHTSGSSINIQAYWTQLLSVGLIESWTHSRFYRVNEVVTLNSGSIYRCSTSHISSSNFFTDVTKWELLHSDLKYWKSNTYYTVGVSVVNDKKLYICKTNHTSGTTFADINWILVSENEYSIPDWETGKDYKENNVVYYYGTIYRAITDHTSSDFEKDSVNWSIIYSDLENWQAGVYYKSGATVVYSNIVYKCKVDHKSASAFSEVNWERIGGSTLATWVSGKVYKVGDKVIYNNSLYTANTEHSSSTFSVDIANWNLIYADIKTWQANSYYSIGVVAIYDDELYRCETPHTSGNSFNKSKWSKIGSSIDVWETDTDYEVGDIVIYKDVMYKCTSNHTSDSSSFINDILKWKVFNVTTAYINTWLPDTYYEANQIVSLNGVVYKCLSKHISESTFTVSEKAKWNILLSSLTDDEVQNIIDIFE